MSLLDKRFCVYLHKRKDNGEVFYVGSGAERRPNVLVKGSRSAAWDAVKDQTDIDVEVVATGLTKAESILEEAATIERLKESCNLINKATPANHRELTREMFPGFEYAPETEGFVTRNGKPVCLGTTRNVRRVTYKQEKYPAHRVIWALVHGSCPTDMLVDHVNGNPLDNRIENLRLVCPTLNQKNRRPETEFPVGIRNAERWCTVLDNEGRNFTINKKYFGDKALLICCEFRLRLFKAGKFKGFTERHMNLKGPYLPEMTDAEIMDALTFTKKLVSSNKTGIAYVCKTANGAWVYQKAPYSARFAGKVIGDEVAKTLALEYKSYVENILPGKPLNLGRYDALKSDTDLFHKLAINKGRFPDQCCVVKRFDVEGRARTLQVECRNYHELIKALRDLTIKVRELK